MQKFFVEHHQVKEGRIILIDSDVNHIKHVLRMQKGDNIQIVDKETLQNYMVQIEEMQKEKIITKILEEIKETVESNIQLDLFQGLPKADKMEWIIQKLTEIGIVNIIPVDMVRCIVKLEPKEEKKKLDRWQKIAEVAAKQSKRDRVPTIKNKLKLKEIADRIKEYDIFLVAYEEEEKNTLRKQLKQLSSKQYAKIAILVGPEGGITKEEIQLLKESGAKVVSLGKRILRTETAPMVMAGNILYELEKEI